MAARRDVYSTFMLLYLSNIPSLANISVSLSFEGMECSSSHKHFSVHETKITQIKVPMGDTLVDNEQLHKLF